LVARVRVCSSSLLDKTGSVEHRVAHPTFDATGENFLEPGEIVKKPEKIGP